MISTADRWTRHSLRWQTRHPSQVGVGNRLSENFLRWFLRTLCGVRCAAGSRSRWHCEPLEYIPDGGRWTATVTCVDHQALLIVPIVLFIIHGRSTVWIIAFVTWATRWAAVVLTEVTGGRWIRIGTGRLQIWIILIIFIWTIVCVGVERWGWGAVAIRIGLIVSLIIRGLGLMHQGFAEIIYHFIWDSSLL